LALWLVRTGRHGEHFAKFVADNRIYLTWGGLDVNLGALASKADLSTLLSERYPSFGPVKLANHTGQIWRFVHELQPNDWVVVPDKNAGAINIAAIGGDYTFNSQGPDPYFHYRDVTWVASDVPRTNFPKDILFSFGGLMTIYKVTRHNAEARVRAMQQSAWKAQDIQPISVNGADADDVESQPDIAQLASDEIAKLIIARFKGHGLARLVDGVLRAQGYTTFVSPEGADKGVDILAGSGELGFGALSLCVQVKSGDSPLDRPTLDQLIGTMQNVGAKNGLLVSWGGFKQTIRREEPSQFFRVRLWDQSRLITEILECYDRLDEELRAELPLKRVWTVARDSTDDGEDEQGAAAALVPG
jgi:restriction system protein